MAPHIAFTHLCLTSKAPHACLSRVFKKHMKKFTKKKKKSIISDVGHLFVLLGFLSLTSCFSNLSDSISLILLADKPSAHIR